TPDPARPVRLRHGWFAQNLTADQYEQLSAWLGVAPRQLYGMTETIPAVLSDRATTPRPDALGTPSPNCRVELHDEQGHPTPPGDVGEVVVGGTPGHTLFAEYLDDPETTSASFRGAWFRTGDRARVGADGRFEFDGRRSDVLKVSGENVSVVEVEAAVASHPDVFDVVVVGAPDPVRDEVPVAFVVPVGNRDHESLVGDLHAWAEQRLGKAKRPRAFTVVDELPRTSVGKVRKFLLSESASKHADDKLETRTVS
ncbi:MAG: AMP-binding protein, partial [Actinomycetota bacterium]